MCAMELSNITKNMLARMFSEGKRFDGRKLDEFRDFEIETGVSNKAEGSARIRLGKTEVVVGVKLAPGTPYPDSLDKGNLVVSGDLLPLASPRFEHGPPDFNAIELPRLIDRAVRGAEMIDLKKLCIKEGEKVWNVFIDIYPINDDGNLIDASTLATIVALHDAVMPGLDDGGNVDYKHRTKNKLPLEKDILPISFTFYKIGDSLILDPTREEEESSEAKISWGMSKLKGEHVLNSCQKGFEIPLTSEEIQGMMKILPKKYDEVLKPLKKYLGKA